MNRRDVLIGSTAVAAVCAIPATATAKPAPIPAHWYAVGDGERCFSYLAESAFEAAKLYAEEFGATKADECPDCGEPNCKEHLAPHEMEHPADWIEVEQPTAWADLIDAPANADWCRAGYHTTCDVCGFGEPTSCQVLDGIAVCDECALDCRSGQ